ncbi:hypothetical protein TSOC_007765 [Tetrabaena socialis]|uniref:O-fucosyltransferase family protein n=1 Tax=Tetrabaena socialis TaxID=47790 RepID=A0A2J8A082_9CHLO|nr:hypothetical protein TSOC_007765 [Tetrabaena socialis]|eukprot:PNH05916.1 hypothetical protein TSOC_007765 [Tetrabaena socialis]
MYSQCCAMRAVLTVQSGPRRGEGLAGPAATGGSKSSGRIKSVVTADAGITDVWGAKGGGAAAKRRSPRGGVAPGRTTVAAAEDGAAADSGPPPFLVPLLPYGLSNQVVALKEALALAAVLKWPVVSYGFWPHHTELEAAGLAGNASQPAAGDAERGGASRGGGNEGGDQEPGRDTVRTAMISYDTIFDRRSLAPSVTIIGLEDAVRQHGWSGRPDVLLSISPIGLTPTTDKLAAAGVLDLQGVAMMRNHAFSGLLRAQLNALPCCTERCPRRVTARMGKSPAIAATARDFVFAALSGARPATPMSTQGQAGVAAAAATTAPPAPYIALHIRPYPDPCLDYFAAMDTFDATDAAKVCKNPRLLAQMVPLVWRAVAAWRGGAGQQGPPPPVFIMSHPRVRDVVRREIRRLWAAQGAAGGAAAAAEAATAAGHEPGVALSLPLPLPALHFLDVSDLPAELRHQVAANSLLSVVEQEVCRTAAVFIGTAASSISVLVAQERAAEAEAVGGGGGTLGGRSGDAVGARVVEGGGGVAGIIALSGWEGTTVLL